MAKLRLAALVFACIQTAIQPGDSATVSWIVVAVLAVDAFGSWGLLRANPGERRVRLVGWIGMAFDTALVVAVMFNNLSDPSDVVWVVVLLPLVEAAMRWTARGGMTAGLLFGVSTAAWSAAVAASLNIPVVPEYLSLRLGVITVLGGFLGLLVQQLAGERRALQQVLHLTRDLMVTVDRKGQIVTVNEAAVTMLGRAEAHLIGMRLDDLVVEGVGDGAPLDLTSESMQERPFRREDGSLVWVQLSVTPDADYGLVYVVGRDVTEKLEQARLLAHQAFHDPLTGVANRMRLMDQITEHLAARSRNLGLLFVDLDRFKMVNDTLGHAGGDELLRAVVGRLRGCVRNRDLVARFAGDEFCVLLPEIVNSAEAMEVAQRIVTALAAPYEISGTEAVVSASVGVALAAPLDTAETLLHHSDQAMYRAKQLGRNRAVLRDPGHHVFGAHVAESIIGAISRDELCLHFQPMFDLADRRVVGMEALVRWEHLDEGLLDPVMFLGAAEDAGVAVALGEWVADRAVAQLAAWRQDGLAANIELSINISAVELNRPETVDMLIETAARHGIEPGAIVIDVSEGAILADPDLARPLLAKLTAAGFLVAIDDFGTGYSSMRQLRSIPADFLKIDRSFVSSMVPGSSDEAIVRSVVGLARSMDVPVVAEGVETQEQLTLLAKLGCARAQGFVLATPARAEDITALLWRRKVTADQ
ncbi:MAG: putative bifunctional diguanylate cyclase/phosphodiesterase [Acidimicrobiales bacterium]